MSDLERYLLEQTGRCLRPPVDRFAHPWIAPMPLSAAGASYLAARQTGGKATPFDGQRARAGTGDGFTSGDYSLGLFHHDASEAAIELLRRDDFREAAAGSLLCLLDCASPGGRVHRAELSHKSREREPSKPILAQYALRVVKALGTAGPGWAGEHRLLERVTAFIQFFEREYVGLHGLFLTHSSLQSGFDNDILTAGMPDCSVAAPDTNAFMVLEYRALQGLTQLLAPTHGPEARAWGESADALAARMNQLLWFEDESGGRYTALRWQHGVGSLDAERVGARAPDGRIRPYESWVCFLPLYAGVPTPVQGDVLCRRLMDPARFWGPHGVRTLGRDDIFFHQAPRALHFDFKKNAYGPVSNWMGPVWILSNYYLAVGLRRYGHAAAAQELSEKTFRLLERDLEATGMLHECYDDAGLGLWPRSGTFISWNVLALTLQENPVPELT